MILTKKGYSGQSIFKMNNADMYEWEYFSKYPQYGYSCRKIGFNTDNLREPIKKKYIPGRRRVMSRLTQYKHKPIHEIESKLYPDYDDGMYQGMYIELKESD
jgi:hypothetical protein